MDISQFFSKPGLFAFFFKSFAIVLSFIYLIYVLTVYRQTQVMLKTLIDQNEKIILLISAIQIALALILIFLSIFVL